MLAQHSYQFSIQLDTTKHRQQLGSSQMTHVSSQYACCQLPLFLFLCQLFQKKLWLQLKYFMLRNGQEGERERERKKKKERERDDIDK